jgi:ribosomal protein S18 acetylase RimI-like enzyme
MLNIRRASTNADFDSARRVFRAYHAIPGLAECVVGFEEEMAGLPGRYAEPQGVLLLASDGGGDVGVVALRPLAEEGVCEMKRLYVEPAARGTGVGQALALTLIEEARKRGYRIMRLDTLPFMKEAIGLYQAIGFRERDRYYEGAPASALFFELDLENFE